MNFDIQNTVYPCVYRELDVPSTLTTPQSRFIPVYTGNSRLKLEIRYSIPVYPCVYRELLIQSRYSGISCGLSLCIQGTHLFCL